jgi:hypothetical protein
MRLFFALFSGKKPSQDIPWKSQGAVQLDLSGFPLLG